MLRSSRLWILGVLWLGLAASSCGGNRVETRKDTWQDALHARYVKAIPVDEPGIGVAVVYGKERFVRAYGLARLEPRTEASGHTQYRMASVSKTMTAVSILVLVDRGKLALEDPVVKHLPRFPYPEITIRHLLNHTSGLLPYEDFEAELLSVRRNPVNADVLAFLAEEEPELLFEPGEEFEYSNVGYDILALVAEAASGMPFALHMREALFEPLGMKDAFVIEPEQRDFGNRAYGYQIEEQETLLDDAHPLNLIVGAGGVFASAEDMAEWARALEPGVLLSEAALEALETLPELSVGETDYGLGWTVEHGRYGLELWHDGSWVGFNTYFVHLPEKQISIAIMANANRDPETFVNMALELLQP